MLINQKRNNGGNFTSVKGSEGGKARAEIQKEEAKLRIDEYNSNPNKCKYCGNPIFAPYDKKLSETKIKKFCSRSCAAKFNNKGQIKNPKGVGSHSIIENYADNEIIEIFENSTSLRDFSNKLGYKSNLKYSNQGVVKKLCDLGLDINELKSSYDQISIFELKKYDLFTERNWQSARSAIQRLARKIYDMSSKPKKCVVCGYDKHYEVAHIKSVSSFDDNALISEINDIDNLIALCPNHHWEYDNDNLDISEYLS